MEANKADWDTLFEAFSFFDAYKNYLQIDVCAETDDDLRQWKGWVGSRLRQLTLKVNYCYFVFPSRCHKPCLSFNSYFVSLIPGLLDNLD